MGVSMHPAPGPVRALRDGWGMVRPRGFPQWCGFLSVCLVAVDLVGWSKPLPAQDLAVTVMTLYMTFLMWHNPKVSCGVFLLMTAIVSMSPDPNHAVGTSNIFFMPAAGYILPWWVVCLAIVFLVAQGALLMSFGMLPSLPADSGATGAWPTSKPGEILMFAAVAALLYVVLFGIGMLMRNRDDKRARRLAEERLRWTHARMVSRQRDAELTAAIHDSVTNDLSYMALMADQLGLIAATLPRNEDTALVVETSRALRERSRHALQAVHEVIDLLEERAPSGGVVSRTALQAAVETLMRDEDAKLRDMGIEGFGRFESGESGESGEFVQSGESHGSGEPDWSDASAGLGIAASVDAAVRDAAIGMIGEIYANLVRHCRPHADNYVLTVVLGRSALRIEESNGYDARRSHAEALDGVRSGRGLGLHRSVIELLGGLIETSGAHGVWRIAVTLPLIPPSRHPAAAQPGVASV